MPSNVPLSKRLGRAADELVRCRPHDVSRERLDELVLLLREGEKALLEVASLQSALALSTQQLGTTHIKVDGRCVSWCYACERKGLQERIKFTENYESLQAELAQPTKD